MDLGCTSPRNKEEKIEKVIKFCLIEQECHGDSYLLEAMILYTE